MDTQIKNRNVEKFLVIFSIFLFFIGLYIGRIIWRINPVERVSQIVSCEGYEEDFLKKMGFKDRSSCVELNLALHKQYVDECLKEIKTSKNESHDKKLIDLCVYHSFEKNDISLSSEYENFLNKKY